MKTMARLWRLFRPERGWFALGLLLALATLSANLVLMGISGWFITAMGLAGVAGAAINYFTPAAVIRACAIVRTAGRYGERLVTHDATLRGLARLRTWLYRRLVPQAAAGGLQDLSPGELAQRLGRDIDLLDNFYLRIGLPLITALIAVAGVLWWLGWQSPPLAWAAGALVLVTGLAGPALLIHAGRRAVAAEEVAQRHLRTEAQDLLQGLDELVFYDAAPQGWQRLEQAGQRLARRQLKLAAHEEPARILPLVGGWLTLWALLVLLLGEVDQQLRPPTHLALFSLLVLALFEAMGPLPTAFRALAPTLAAARRIFSLADRPSPLPDPAGPAPQPSSFGYRLEKVTLIHPGAQTPVLKDLDLELPAGSHTAIVGPSGAGKSSLLQLLVRFRLPSEGQVTFGGIDLADWPAAALRSHLGVVEQQPHLFIGTLADNLRLARPDASDDQLWHALELACLKAWARALPQGLDTEVGEAALRISGGEARRLALARALLRDSPVLILDEPTEGLDRRTADELMKKLLDHCRGRTLIIATHQLDWLEEMDQVALLDDGRLVAHGAHQRLMESCEPYRRLQALVPRL